MIGLRAVTPWIKRFLLPDRNFFWHFLKAYRWIYAPTPSAFIFAIRTSFASFLALAIALWMEMDSPKWAPMTVWVCARNTSRGETLSKAHWRAVGTVFGAVAAVFFVALFPQQPWLFNITVSIFVAVCVWCGTCLQSFKAYAMVLSGYTCAIIAFTTTSNPHGTFMMAMARTSYILLGVWADSFVGRFFDVNIDRNARKELNANLKFVIQETVLSVLDLLSKESRVVSRSQELLASVIRFDSTVEFRQIEMSGHDHTGDHAHAAFFFAAAVLARSMGLSIFMTHFQDATHEFSTIFPKVKQVLDALLKTLDGEGKFEDRKQELNRLRWDCRQWVADSFYKKIKAGTQQDHERDMLFNDRILFHGLNELLEDLQIALDEYQKSSHVRSNDRFRFHVPTLLNYDLAWKNGLRSFVATMAACLMWYVTGWNMGGAMASLTGMGCARFCLFENPSSVTYGWFKGTMWALFAGGLLVFYLIPPVSNFEMLCMAMFIPTLLGGLGIADLAIMPVAAPYAAYLPYMIDFNNQGRVDESMFLNNALSLFMGMFFAIAAFRLIYPYSPLRTRLHLRQMLLKRMHILAMAGPVRQKPRIWLFQTAALLVNMVRQLSGETNDRLIRAYSLGTVAVMMIGVNVLRLKSMIENDIVTNDIKLLLRIVLHRISRYTGKYGRTVAISRIIIQRLRKQERTEKNLALRMEIIAAVSCLTVIVDCLTKNKAFLDISHPYLLKEEKINKRLFK